MALPNKIQNNAITGASLPSTIDNDINALKLGVIDILGIPDNTNISAAGLNFVAAGLDRVIFQDAAGSPSAAGRFQRNAANLEFHDGTAARIIANATNTLTLTNKTLTAPAISDPVLSGTATGTYTMGGTPTIASPILSGTATGTYTIGGTPTILDSVFRVSGSVDATKKVAFEVDGLTAATTRTVTVQDEDGTLALTSEFTYSNLAGSVGRMPFPNRWMQGFTFANNGVDAINDLDIAAGECCDATNAHNLIGAALTKQSDVAWAVGNNAGMLDTGAVGNSDYYIWAIKRSDTGVVDYLSSLSSTAPTMPTNYDFKRLIGWFKRVGGTIVAFKTFEAEGGGLELQWTAPTLDVSLINTLTTARRTDAVKVPLGFSTIAHLNVVIDDTSTCLVWICCPDQTDAAPSLTVAPLANHQQVAGSSVGIAAAIFVRTSASGLIAARATVATIDRYAVSTMGFTWARKN
jgi:hypothetical protein